VRAHSSLPLIDERIETLSCCLPTERRDRAVNGARSTASSPTRNTPAIRNGLHGLERCLEAGCDFGDLLSTRDRAQFTARMIEARVAAFFLERGFKVHTLRRANRRIADLQIPRDDLKVTAEVYSPRMWEAIADWQDAVPDRLSNLDLPFDYSISIDTHDTFLSPPPWEIALVLRHTAEAVLDAVEADLSDALARGVGMCKEYHHGDHDLVTRVELEHAQRNDRFPRRRVVAGGPSLSGYSPSGVFRRIVDRKVPRKARRAQSQLPGADVRALIVDLGRSQVAHYVRRQAHRPEPRKVLDSLELSALGLELIAFCGPPLRQRDRLFADFIVYDDARITDSDVTDLLG
jgi:hypothetical protein